MKVLVTGGCGFIGSHLVRLLVHQGACEVLNLDALTYAGTPASVADVAGFACYQFAKVDLRDAAAVAECVAGFRPDWIMHLAAESHVDRSIQNPDAFIQTNVVGTCNLLNAALAHYESLKGEEKNRFRFLHMSTDEVYGSLGASGLFAENSRYDPRSPYSASKAASDHIARAWNTTYGLPVIVTHCCNNYGPFQFPEKLVPTVILMALQGNKIPVYGKGENIRDWMYVRDHIEALLAVMHEGRIGETYNIGAHNEWRNIDLVRTLCGLLDELMPREDGLTYAKQITFVTDRPGHDRRYAIDASKIRQEIGWSPKANPETGFRETVQWYMDHGEWSRQMLDRCHRPHRD